MKKFKEHLKNIYSRQDGMELIQVIIIILIAVVIGVALMNFAQGMFDSVSDQANDSLKLTPKG